MNKIKLYQNGVAIDLSETFKIDCGDGEVYTKEEIAVCFQNKFDDIKHHYENGNIEHVFEILKGMTIGGNGMTLALVPLPLLHILYNNACVQNPS